MSEESSAMAIDERNESKTNPPLNQSSTSVESTPRYTPRKLPKFPVDLHMPMTVYWPYDDDKIIRSLREWEYGGPLPPPSSSVSLAASSPSVSETESNKKEIPLPGVRIMADYERDTAADFALPAKKYLKYSPPSWFETAIHFDRGRVEYSIDDEDLKWLEEAELTEQVLDEEAMEILIDVLEKESFRQLEFRQITSQIAQVEPVDEAVDDEDQPCSACGEKDFDEENLILFCDGCDLPIHQNCIDLKDIPDGDWFCDTCVYRMRPNSFGSLSHNASHSKRKPSSNNIDFSIAIPCVLCSMVDGGMFKKTNLPGRFVHAVCALMTPEVWFEKDWANVSKALQARKNTVCQVCSFAGGVVKCSHRGCFNHHHVPCARENGQMLYFNVPDPECEDDAEEARNDGSFQNFDAQLALLNGSSSVGDSLNNINVVVDDNSETTSERNGTLDESCSEVDILGLDDGSVSLNTSTVSSHASEKAAPTTTTTKQPQKKRKKQRLTKKPQARAPHQPFQSLCGLHSATLKVKKLEEARKASLQIPIEVGKFLDQEQAQDDDDYNVAGGLVVGDTTTFSKSVDILRKYHSKHLELEKSVFERVVAYWKQKRLAKRKGHMPLIFQLHVLVTHFRENFDAGRTLANNRPRQVELTLAQYAPQKKLQILRDLRDGVESLRTLLDLIKKREVKKRQAMQARLELFEAIVRQDRPTQALDTLYQPTRANKRPSHFAFNDPALTIVIPTSALPKSRRETVIESTSVSSAVSASPTASTNSNSYDSTSSTSKGQNQEENIHLANSPPLKKKAPFAFQSWIVPSDQAPDVRPSSEVSTSVFQELPSTHMTSRLEPVQALEAVSSPTRPIVHASIDISDSPPKNLTNLMEVAQNHVNILFGGDVMHEHGTSGHVPFFGV